MKPTPIPMMPVLGCLIGIGTIGLALWHHFAEATPNYGLVALETVDRVQMEEVVPLRYYDTPIAIETAEIIVTSSGFSPDRSAYSRSVQRATPEPREPEYEPKYIGSLGRGDQAKIMIVWKPGTDPQTHAIGDETPWGRLTDVTNKDLIFDRSGVRISLSIY